MGVSNSARMYTYDSEFDAKVSQLELDRQLTTTLRRYVHNQTPWAKQYKTAVDEISGECQATESPTSIPAFIEFAEVSRVNDGNVIGQLVAAPEMTAILYKDTPNTSQRTVVTHPKNSPDSTPCSFYFGVRLMNPFNTS